jgi:hypothetical protein
MEHRMYDQEELMRKQVDVVVAARMVIASASHGC